LFHHSCAIFVYCFFPFAWIVSVSSDVPVCFFNGLCSRSHEIGLLECFRGETSHSNIGIRGRPALSAAISELFESSLNLFSLIVYCRPFTKCGSQSLRAISLKNLRVGRQKSNSQVCSNFRAETFTAVDDRMVVDVIRELTGSYGRHT